MPPLGPIKRREFIACLRALGFSGPYAGGKHEFMKGCGIKIRIPNPHEGDLTRGLLARIPRDAGIDRKDWEAL